MSAIQIDERFVHYEVLGRGRPVIFLHGWIGSWRYWVPAMQTAATSFRAYALDLWGFGDTAHEQGKYTLDQQMTLLDRFLQELGIMKVALVGHGLGALVTLLFAHHFPGMVDRMMLIGCPLGIGAINERLRNALPADLSEWLLTKDPLTEPARTDSAKADPQAMIISFHGLETADVSQLINNMGIPCLLVHGQNDPAISNLDNERLSTLPMLVHQIVLEESGHFPMLDEGPRFNRLLTDFLALESGESPRQLQLKEEWKRRVR
jgi:pimeloyl-ACP methyl ester carboxylesterase